MDKNVKVRVFNIEGALHYAIMDCAARVGVGKGTIDSYLVANDFLFRNIHNHQSKHEISVAPIESFVPVFFRASQATLYKEVFGQAYHLSRELPDLERTSQAIKYIKKIDRDVLRFKEILNSRFFGVTAMSIRKRAADLGLLSEQSVKGSPLYDKDKLFWLMVTYEDELREIQEEVDRVKAGLARNILPDDTFELIDNTQKQEEKDSLSIFRMVKSRVSILMYVAKRLDNDYKLETQGDSFRLETTCAHCKSGKMTVSNDKGVYYCFECKKGGDIIAMESRLYELSPEEAATKIAKDFNIIP